MSQLIAHRIRPLLACLALATAVPAACGPSDHYVSTSAAAIDRSVRPLISTGGTLLYPKSIKGTYSLDCEIRSEDRKWELKLDDPASKFQLARNDAFDKCFLVLTAVSVQVGSQTPAVDYPVVPPLVIDNTYHPRPSVVNTPLDVPAFHVNARFRGLSSPSYGNDFGIDLLYSDDALACGSVAPTALYAKVTVTSTDSSVAVPNYEMSFDGLQLALDSEKVVQSSSSGSVAINLPPTQGQGGEEWRLFHESTTCCSSYYFAEIDALYKTVTPDASGTMSGASSVSIPWTRFTLVDKTLPRHRTLIVKHSAGGAYSYELFQILFPGPN